jgi:hypothetical protein
MRIEIMGFSKPGIDIMLRQKTWLHSAKLLIAAHIICNDA